MNSQFDGQLTPPVSGRDHQQGAQNAPVTLVEYGDYECPDCGIAFPIVKAIQQQMGGQLRFVFRNFPLQMHPYAEPAAEAAESAGAQEDFWPMHDTLYEHQQRLAPPYLEEYAREQGLNMGEFNEAMNTHEFEPRVRRDYESGLESGVQGTPTFFINGRKYTGSYDVQTLLGVLQQVAGAR